MATYTDKFWILIQTQNADQQNAALDIPSSNKWFKRVPDCSDPQLPFSLSPLTTTRPPIRIPSLNLQVKRRSLVLHFHVYSDAALLAEEEPVDQKKYLEEGCKPKCVKPLLEYQACVKRIQDDDTGHKHCTGQYFDYWFCIDKCVAPKLFQQLK
ncbi:hypothetical protein K2173_021116 [Erythroxylum novogranatense]|uniref:Complex III subunit VI n=1 Tax=Erythroxylum novogranatense TaxID=1862640 RepID=A0AAV8TMM7_9ROSI|nr:hypothetical protein K2173_021116 [Erythroxylum novogranatense]